MRKLLIISLILLLSVVILGLNEEQVRSIARAQALEEAFLTNIISFTTGGLLPFVGPLVVCGTFLILRLEDWYPPSDKVLEISMATGGDTKLIEIYKQEYRSVFSISGRPCLWSWLGTGVMLGLLAIMWL